MSRLAHFWPVCRTLRSAKYSDCSVVHKVPIRLRTNLIPSDPELLIERVLNQDTDAGGISIALVGPASEEHFDYALYLRLCVYLLQPTGQS
jgi:hypothetical protein